MAFTLPSPNDPELIAQLQGAGGGESPAEEAPEASAADLVSQAQSLLDQAIGLLSGEPPPEPPPNG